MKKMENEKIVYIILLNFDKMRNGKDFKFQMNKLQNYINIGFNGEIEIGKLMDNK